MDITSFRYCGDISYTASGTSTDTTLPYSTIRVTDDNTTPGMMNMHITPSSANVFGTEDFEFTMTLTDTHGV